MVWVKWGGGSGDATVHPYLQDTVCRLTTLQLWTLGFRVKGKRGVEAARPPYLSDIVCRLTALQLWTLGFRVMGKGGVM